MVAKASRSRCHSLISINTQGGFILVSSLWMVAILLIIAAAFGRYTDEKVDQAILTKQRLQGAFDQKSTEQTLLYLFATQRTTLAGLTTKQQTRNEYTDAEGNISLQAIGGELRLSGVGYSGVGDTHFELYDRTGLLSLNTDTHYHLKTLIKRFEENNSQRDILLSRLLDYRDANDLIRLNGAERREYELLNLKPPSNDNLRTELELKYVLGWKTWLDKHEDFNCAKWCSIARSTLLNPNTMPSDLFRHFWGLPNDIADKVLESRATKPFISIADFKARSGLHNNLAEEYYRFFPSQHIKMKLYSKGGRQAVWIALQFTPNGLLGPWLINYKYSQELTRKFNENTTFQTPGELFKTEHSTD